MKAKAKATLVSLLVLVMAVSLMSSFMLRAEAADTYNVSWAGGSGIGIADGDKEVASGSTVVSALPGLPDGYYWTYDDDSAVEATDMVEAKADSDGCVCVYVEKAAQTVTYNVSWAGGESIGITDGYKDVEEGKTVLSALPELPEGYYWTYDDDSAVGTSDMVEEKADADGYVFVYVEKAAQTVTYNVSWAGGESIGITDGYKVVEEGKTVLSALPELPEGYYWTYDDDSAVGTSDMVEEKADADGYVFVYVEKAAQTVTYNVSWAGGEDLGIADGYKDVEEGTTVMSVLDSLGLSEDYYWTYFDDSKVDAADKVEEVADADGCVYVYVAHDHVYVGEVTKEATCETAGETTYTCSICGDTYVMPIAATGHIYGEPVFDWSDDYSTATASFACSKCGKITVVEATVSSTTNADGTVVYTATAIFNGTEYVSDPVSVNDNTDGKDSGSESGDNNTTGGNSSGDNTGNTTGSNSGTTDTASDTSSTSSVKTGVEDNLLFYALAALAAMGLVVVAADRKQKSR